MLKLARIAGLVVLVGGLMAGQATVAVAQGVSPPLPPDAVRLRLDQVVTVCGTALDLGCDGPHANAILTFVTPSASPSVTVAAAPGARIDLDARPLIHAQPVCVTGTVVPARSGRQLQITTRDQIVFNTQSAPQPDPGQQPRRSCEPGAVAPKFRKDMKPTYTADAMRRKVQGRVTLQGIVDLSGRMRDVQVIRTLDPGEQDVACVEALEQWEFEPGQMDGTPVPMAILFDMTFSIRRD